MRQVTRLIAVLCVSATAVFGFSSAASAAPTEHRETTTTSVRAEAATAAQDVVAAGSGSKCGETKGYGKIKYQACFSWACTSTCSTRGYLGIINTATTSRTVNWDLDFKSPWDERHDDSGTWTLAAGAQKTIWSDLIWSHPGCGFTFTQTLKIQYGSAPWSPYINAAQFLPCS